MLWVDPFVYLFGAVLLLTLPMPWLFAAVFAAGIHELCHFAVLYLVGGRMYRIQIGIGGAAMDTELPNRTGELLCAAAGPMGSLLLFSLYHRFPRLAICAGIQGIFNLIPVYPLDGGRILYCCLGILFPQKAERIEKTIEQGLMILLGVLAIIGAACFSMGAFPLVLTAVLIIKLRMRKRPCKQSTNRVQ